MSTHPGQWRHGNDTRLLENGEQYFPAVFDAIAAAREEILIETFILRDDEVGRALHAACIGAAARGVRVHLTVDGYGSPDLPPAFVAGLLDAGVCFRSFDPVPSMATRRLKALRRLHRKLVVIDREVAFVGGINFSADHLHDAGPHGKQDFAVQLRGPVVADIHQLVTLSLDSRDVPRPRPWWRSRARAPVAGDAIAGDTAKFVWRDNHHYEDAIELHYRQAIRNARRDILIANAYFFPGYRLIHELRLAARRGIRTRLILQGQRDIPIACWAARSLYQDLMRAGVVIHECACRPLHAKVAVIDDHWVTIGSSNLDPSSLSLNLEANLVVESRRLARELRERLEALIAQDCVGIDPRAPPLLPWGQRLLAHAAFHLIRLFPHWQHMLPQRVQALETPRP